MSQPVSLPPKLPMRSNSRLNLPVKYHSNRSMPILPGSDGTSAPDIYSQSPPLPRRKSSLSDLNLTKLAASENSIFNTKPILPGV
jgi:hypothetical protein